MSGRNQEYPHVTEQQDNPGGSIEAREYPPVTEPENVPEILCIGRFNVHATGPLVTLTFTHARPKSKPLFDGTFDMESIVRARIVTSIENVIALRDALIKVTQAENPACGTGGSKH